MLSPVSGPYRKNISAFCHQNVPSDAISNVCYDSEDKVLIPHHHVAGEENVDVEANFTMTLNVDKNGKPAKIAEFSFADDYISVSLMPNDYDFK